MSLIHLSQGHASSLCREILGKKRSQAKQSVQSLEFSPDTKIWLTELSDTEFETAILELEKLSVYFLEPTYKDFLVALIKTPSGRKALAQLTELELSEKTKSIQDPDLGEVIFNSLLLRVLYFTENEAVRASKDVFLEIVNEAKAFGHELENLHKAYMETPSLLNEKAKKAFLHYLGEGVFLNVNNENRSHALNRLFQRQYEVANEITQPHFDLHQMIYSYEDWKLPQILLAKLLKTPLAYLIQKRRDYNFRFFEYELFQVMAAAVQNTYKLRAEFVSDFFYSLEAFEARFLSHSGASAKNHFMVSLQHNFPVLLKAISVDGDGRSVSGAMVSMSVYKLIDHWCQRFDLETPEYLPVSQE